MKEGHSAKEPQVGSRGGEEGWPHFVTPLARISGQNWKVSASCKCSHLISQLTKYYGLAHKNQSAKLPGVLNSRSCDQKQVGSGDTRRRLLQQGRQLPPEPLGSQVATETKQET